MNTILIVDDEEEIRNSIAEMLAHKFYKVEQARNGKEALEIISRKKPDLIISDIRMPVMDGMKLLKEIKQQEILKDIPVIVLSAKSSGSNRETCLENGASEYLSKPFNAADLYKAVEQNIKINNS
jgi:CheY-like chemotaxis protein